MTIVYRLVGYDKATERKHGEFAIPEERLAAVREIARILPADDGLGDYPLDDEQARTAARVLNVTIDCARLAYYVEPYDMPAAKNRA